MLLENLIDPEIEQFNKSRHAEISDPLFIPIHITGGIGDVIISIDNIRFLKERFNVVVYTHHVEAFKYFYRDSIPVFKTLPEYTWILSFNTFVKFIIRDKFHGFLIKDHEELYKQQQLMFKHNPRLETIVKTDCNKFFLISSLAKEMNQSRWSFQLFSLGYEDRPNYKLLPKSYPEKYITIHDGFDIHNRSIVSGRATKQWKWDHWNKLVRLIKWHYPDYKVIQLGTSHTAREIDGIDESLIDKTTITEAFDILSKSSLHIDGDSGLIHAANRMQVPSIVLWGPTPLDFYSYKENINLKSNVCSQACYGVKENWNDKCVIGYSSPKCMDEIHPHQVLESVKEILK